MSTYQMITQRVDLDQLTRLHVPVHVLVRLAAVPSHVFLPVRLGWLQLCGLHRTTSSAQRSSSACNVPLVARCHARSLDAQSATPAGSN